MKILERIWLNGCHGIRFSVAGADELMCCQVHLRLCSLSPIDALAMHSTVLAQLPQADVAVIHAAICHEAVQSGDVAGIMAMRAPLPAPEPAIPEVKSSPEGLRTISDMDHRLGAWK